LTLLRHFQTIENNNNEKRVRLSLRHQIYLRATEKLISNEEVDDEQSGAARRPTGQFAR